jgi:hypothetical protein
MAAVEGAADDAQKSASCASERSRGSLPAATARCHSATAASARSRSQVGDHPSWSRAREESRARWALSGG